MPEQSLTLGLAAGTTKSLFRGEEVGVDLIPLIQYEIGRFEIDPFGLTATLWEWQGTLPADQPDIESPWDFSVHANIEFGFDKRDQNESPVFAGMEDRDEDTLLSLSSDWVTPVGLFAFSFSGDVSDASGGLETEIGWGIPLTSIGAIDTWFTLSTLFQSLQVVDYHYGVRANEVTDNRQAYRPVAAITPSMNFGADVVAVKGWEFGVTIIIERIPNEILRSPLTESDRFSQSIFLFISKSFEW